MWCAVGPVMSLCAFLLIMALGNLPSLSLYCSIAQDGVPVVTPLSSGGNKIWNRQLQI
jgi:hypothetical protein